MYLPDYRWTNKGSPPGGPHLLGPIGSMGPTVKEWTHQNLTTGKMGTTTTKPPNETVHQPLPSTLFRGFKDEISFIRKCAWLASSNPQLPPTVSLLIPIPHIQTRSSTKKDTTYQTRKQQEGKSQTVTNRTLTHSPKFPNYAISGQYHILNI